MKLVEQLERTARIARRFVRFVRFGGGGRLQGGNPPRYGRGGESEGFDAVSKGTSKRLYFREKAGARTPAFLRVNTNTDGSAFARVALLRDEIVKRVDFVDVTLTDDVALQFESRGEKTVVDRPGVAQELHLTRNAVIREARGGELDALQCGLTYGLRVERRVVLGIEPELVAKFLEGVGMYDRERGDVGLVVADDHRLREKSVRFDCGFEVRGRYLFTRRRDDDFLDAARDADVPVAVDFGHVARLEPAVLGEDGARGVVAVPRPEVFRLLILFVFFCGLLLEVFSFPASFFPQFLLSLLPLSSLFLILWERDPIFSSFSLWRFPFLKKHPLGWKGKQLY